MYYIIKRQYDTPPTYFVGFTVPKYIAGKNTESIILEFVKDGKTIRKWLKKADIILLTDNKKYFLETMSKFKEIENTQQKLVDEAQKNLEKTMETFTETVNAEIDNFEELKSISDIPCFTKRF